MTNFLTDHLSKYLSDSTIRRLLRAVPYKRFNDVMRISDTMARRSQEIVSEKKAALAKGGVGSMLRALRRLIAPRIE